MSRQHNPPHPGELIREVYLEPFKDNLSRSEVARHLSVSRSNFNRLVNEQVDVTSEMALRLSKVLGGTPESWMRLQINYDLWQARKKVKVSNLKPLQLPV
jgi:addiction module HigA family antidote